MRIGFYSPYPETLGGGERYLMTAAACLSKLGHRVDIFWDDSGVREDLSQRFALDLSGLNFIKDIFRPEVTPLVKWRVTRKYDAFFFVSDGSLPLLFSKKNIIHFQVPFTHKNGQGLLNKIKVKKIDRVICNSQFTLDHIKREYALKGQVIYPPVDVANLKPGKKEKIILSVGRLGEMLNNKKQEVLISAFGQMLSGSQSRLLKGWRLVMAGGVRSGDEKYLIELREQAEGLPVEFLVNQGFGVLKEYYAKANIFWHAAGFGEDEKNNPERMEHFGIVVVEAMAAGCVPVVVGKGGIPEIIKHQKNGFLWQNLEELVGQTVQLIKSPETMKKIAAQAVQDSRQFSSEIFCQRINELVKT